LKRRNLRIAIIGCGAAAEIVHLPAFAKIGLKPVLLVDKDLKRAEVLAKRFQISNVSEDYQENIRQFDAAIVAVPHYLHTSVTLDLLGKGIHVLLEKPMAMTSAESNEMLTAAQRTETVFAVGMFWHFRKIHNWVKSGLDCNFLGDLESFDFQEGSIFDWPIVSEFTFLKDMGGGVLLDTGAHVLDLLIWWLGEVSDHSYHDDSLGGVAANCEMNLTLASGVKGFVTLSRTRNLRNTAIIKGSQGEIEVGLSTDRLRANPPRLLNFKVGHQKGNRLGTQKTGNSFELQLLDWIGAIETGKQPSISGESTARSIALIEGLQSHRQTMEHPWSELS
jgi:predicted dehydrogenase